MNIVGGSNEVVFPLNIGLMMFNEEPQRFFPQAQIDVVWFPDGPGGDTFTEKIFYGPLHRMTRDALDWIKRRHLSETVIKHRDRAEATRVSNFPYDAIEEALVNAVYHRSYEIREPVEVRISPEELSVVSYPGPDRSVRLETLRTGRALSRRYRNRRIGEFFKELGLTEGRGTGVPKIHRAMTKNGSPEAVFEFDDEHSYFAVILPAHPPTIEAAGQEATQEVTPEVTPEVTREVRLLRTLHGEMTRRELQDALGLKDDEYFRTAYLIPAMEQGWIEMTIPDKPRSSRQRYRLTEAGREILDQG